MSTARRGRPRLRIGIAFAGDALVVRAAPSVLPGDEWRSTVSGAPDKAGEWPELGAVFLALRNALANEKDISASVAILPPLVQLRRLSLPPLRPEERRRALTRDAARYFVGAREAHVADAHPVLDAEGGVIAAAVPARYVEAMVRAADRVGITIRTIQPAPWAWAALVEREHRPTTRALIVVGTHGIDVVWLVQGTVTGVRRLRETGGVLDELATLLADEGASGERAAVIGGGTRAESLAARLGLRTVAGDDEPLALAASMARRAHGPELLPEFARSTYRAGIRRRAQRLAVGAAVLLLVAAALELWGVHRQLGAVRRERAAMQGAVARAIAGRDSATSLELQFAAVAAMTHDAPRWTGVLANLAQTLPDDAHIVSLSASGDSLALVGEAAHAADVFEALRRDTRVAGIRADAPIHREFAADRTAIERFSVTARLTSSALTELPARDSTGERP